MRWASPRELYKIENTTVDSRNPLRNQEQRKGRTIHGLRTAWKTRNRYRR